MNSERLDAEMNSAKERISRLEDREERQAERVSELKASFASLGTEIGGLTAQVKEVSNNLKKMKTFVFILILVLISEGIPALEKHIPLIIKALGLW